MGYGRVNALRALQATLPTVTGGTNTLCMSSSINTTFTLSAIPGNSSVTWSVSPTSYFATTGGASTSGSGGTATIRASSNFAGSATISFVIQGPCNTNTVTRTIWVGTPANLKSKSRWKFLLRPYLYLPRKSLASGHALGHNK
jgi:hypothetical protein